MKQIITILFLFYSFTLLGSDFYLYRKNLAIAPKNENICLEMISALGNVNNSNISLGYLGAYTMIKANHLFNPLQKLNAFKAGRKLLEKSIQNEPNNIELRYIRYAIQLSIPSFLGYKDNLKEDKIILQENVRNVDASLRKDIIKLVILKESKT